MEAIDLVDLYTNGLIDTNEYICDENYFEKMIMGFDEYLYSYRVWGKYSAIRPEYRENIIKSINEMGED